MIKKIKKIHKFGIFHKFNWPNSLGDFKKYNFIYGYNYSGKTTLSRIFRSIQTGIIEDDYKDCEFEIELQDATVIKSNSLSSNSKIVVFNPDFIEENLKWKSESNPVMIIGKDIILLQDEYDKKLIELEQKEKEEQNFKKNYEEDFLKFNKALTDNASFIKNNLRIPTYFKNHLENDFKRIQKDVFNLKLTDDKLNELIMISKESNLKEIKNINLSIPKLNDYVLRLNKLRKKTAVQSIIEHLKNNRDIESWVEKGLPLHKDKTLCEFCDSPINKDRIEYLEKHFSTSYKELKEEIIGFKNSIISINLDLQLHEPDLFSISYQNEIRRLNIAINEELKMIKEIKESLIKSISEKEENILDSLSEEKKIQDYESKKIENLIKEYNIQIQMHNKDIINLEEKRKKAQEAILDHYIAELAIKEDYFEKIIYFDNQKKQLKSLQTDVETLKNDCNVLKSKIFSADNGAALISNYLSQFYKKQDLILKANNNNHIQIFRGSKLAKNLSEGEKTAIALCYFIAKASENSRKIEDLIVFIDDPISSLDSNHIYNTYGVIKEVFAKAEQLFISTHNIDLFSMCQEWKGFLRNNGGNFFIAREYISSSWQSKISDPPKLLTQYKSDYNYLFAKMIKFYRDQTSFTEEEAFILPNILRRFLETYLNFRFPGEHYLTSFKRIIDPVNSSSIYKLLNEHSHFLNMNGVIAHQRKTEIYEMAKAIVEGVESNDKDHFDCLIKIIDNS